jgi:hypothetical protein
VLLPPCARRWPRCAGGGGAAGHGSALHSPTCTPSPTSRPPGPACIWSVQRGARLTLSLCEGGGGRRTPALFSLRTCHMPRGNNRLTATGSFCNLLSIFFAMFGFELSCFCGVFVFLDSNCRGSLEGTPKGAKSPPPPSALPWNPSAPSFCCNTVATVLFNNNNLLAMMSRLLGCQRIRSQKRAGDCRMRLSKNLVYPPAPAPPPAPVPTHPPRSPPSPSRVPPPWHDSGVAERKPQGQPRCALLWYRLNPLHSHNRHSVTLILHTSVCSLSSICSVPGRASLAPPSDGDPPVVQ